MSHALARREVTRTERPPLPAEHHGDDLAKRRALLEKIAIEQAKQRGDIARVGETLDQAVVVAKTAYRAGQQNGRDIEALRQSLSATDRTLGTHLTMIRDAQSSTDSLRGEVIQALQDRDAISYELSTRITDLEVQKNSTDSPRAIDIYFPGLLVGGLFTGVVLMLIGIFG